MDNQRIMSFYKFTNLVANHDETPWCSAFLNLIMASTSRESTKNALASSWYKWARETSTPQVGDVAISSDGHHIGIVSRIDENNLIYNLMWYTNDELLQKRVIISLGKKLERWYKYANQNHFNSCSITSNISPVKKQFN